LIVPTKDAVADVLIPNYISSYTFETMKTNTKKQENHINVIFI